MMSQTRARRVSRLLAATSLTVGSVWLVPGARAQEASDPPWRVGRLARTGGSVSTHGAGATDWTAAVLNMPLSSGDAIWTQPSSTAEIQISDDAVVLADSTELDVATLDNQQFVATAPQGELFLDLRDVPQGDSYTITTPRGAVQIGGAGQYGIVAGDSGTPTIVSVISGSARIVSGSFSLDIAANQSATVTGSDSLQGSIGPLLRDAFLSAQFRSPAPPAVAAPQAVRYMTGGESLGQYGAWQPSPDYGQVWYPRVASGWAPYREGSWSYVAPWGWTWVDNEPWGFAPFHYGRWSQFNGRWGWVPGERQEPDAYVQQPTYAPALVDFVVAGAVGGVIGGALAGGFDHGGGGGGYGRGGDVGWIPLGPREAYHPTFDAGQTYLSRVNYGRIDNHAVNSSIDSHNVSNTIINNYANRAALTVVPASAMARSEPVGRVARTGAAALGAAGAAGHGGAAPQFQPVRGAFPVHPAADTRGVTPAVVQRLGLGAAPNRAGAPGPAVNQALFQPHALPASRAPFRGTAVVAAHPQATVPAGGPARPPAPGPQIQPARPNGLPALRTQGAPPAGVPGASRPVAAPGPATAGHAAEPAHPGLPPLRPGGATAEVRQGSRPAETARPVASAAVHAPSGAQPGAAQPAPHVARPLQLHQAPPHAEPARAPEAAHAAAPSPRPQAPRAAAPAPRPEAARPVPHAEPARAVPHPEPARPAPRPEPARPAPRPAPAPAAHPGDHRDDRHEPPH